MEETDVKRLLALLLVLISLAPCAVAERLPDEVLLTYYDDSIFFGDSITQGFRRYVSNRQQTDPGFMSGVEIVCTASISLYEGSRRGLQTNRFRYRGQDRTLYQITQQIRPQKVFILLGLNDPVGIQIEKAMGWIRDIMRGMDELCPGVEVYFFSMTPVTPGYCSQKNRPRYQEQVDEYNARLIMVCTDMGAHYVDIATPLKDENGYLAYDYSSDKICHLSDEGAAVWVQALCDYAQEQYDLGLWVPGQNNAGPELTPSTATDLDGATPSDLPSVLTLDPNY